MRRLPDWGRCGCFDWPEKGVVGLREIGEGDEGEDEVDEGEREISDGGDGEEEGGEWNADEGDEESDEDLMERSKRTAMSEDAWKYFLRFARRIRGIGFWL